MHFLIGYSGAIALVIFAIGGAVSLFVRDASWTDRLIMATMPAAITFVAVLLLSSRDHAKNSATMRSVRNRLLAGTDTTDDDFVSLRPFNTTAILLETRKAISRFFDVPACKINRDVRLIQDLHVDKLEPAFQLYVVDSVIASQQIAPKPFGFSMVGLDTIDDLAVAIQNVLVAFDKNSDNQEGNPRGGVFANNAF